MESGHRESAARSGDFHVHNHLFARSLRRFPFPPQYGPDLSGARLLSQERERVDATAPYARVRCGSVAVILHNQLRRRRIQRPAVAGRWILREGNDNSVAARNPNGAPIVVCCQSDRSQRTVSTKKRTSRGSSRRLLRDN